MFFLGYLNVKGTLYHYVTLEFFLGNNTKKCWVVSTQNWVKYGRTQILG